MALSAAQRLEVEYKRYIQERANKLEMTGKPLTLELFKHYQENFASVYASAHAFEEEVRKQAERDAQAEKLREAMRMFAGN